jgi:hypothetical protein
MKAWKSIIVLRTCHWTLPWIVRIQSTGFLSLRCILTWLSHICLDLPSGLVSLYNVKYVRWFVFYVLDCSEVKSQTCSMGLCGLSANQEGRLLSIIHPTPRVQPSWTHSINTYTKEIRKLLLMRPSSHTEPSTGFRPAWSLLPELLVVNNIGPLILSHPLIF